MNSTLNMTARGLLGSVAAAAVLATAAFAVQAQDSKMPMVKQAPDGASYVNGGIADDEQKQMKGMAAEWPLRVTSALASGGNYVSEVHLVVKAKDGKTMLDLKDAGPMTFVKLPAGDYKVMAEYMGQSESRDVSLSGKGGHDVDFRWKAASK